MSVTLIRRNIYFALVIDEEMKYLQTINITGGGTLNDITTTIGSGTEPYNLELITSDGTVITSDFPEPVWSISGGVYHLAIYNGGGTLNSVKLKVLY